MVTEVAAMRSLVGLEDSFPRWLFSHAWQIDLASVHHVDNPMGLLRVLTTWRLASPIMCHSQDQGGSSSAIHDLATEVTYYPSPHILLLSMFLYS